MIGGMAVEIEGQGEPLVMIHGLGGTSNVFTPQMALLASRMRVIRPDLPGSGRSPVRGTPTIAHFVDRLLGLMAELDINQAHIAGHSLGSMVALHAAAAQPALVKSLVLLGPFLAPPESARAALRDRAAKARVAGMQPIADAIVQGSTAAATRRDRPVVLALIREMLMRQDPEGYALTCEALAAADAPDIGAIKCRTLLIAGDEDSVAPAGGARDIAGRMADARLTVLAQSGHWMSLEKAADVTDALREIYFGRA